MADPGFEVERVRFDRLLPLAEGFEQIAKYIKAAGRPLTSFCACELRSPAAFTEDGFRAFNQHYVKTLAEWGLFDGTTNPVARSNVCPEIDPPAEPSFYAFSFTRPSHACDSELRDRRRRRNARRQPAAIPSVSCATATLSPDGLKEKVRFTVGEMQSRLGAFGFGWKEPRRCKPIPSTTSIPSMADELVRHGAMRSGLTWHFARPPVLDLEYEMDCRRVMREVVI